jgi:SAM-dependent methyltransferase
MEISEKERIKEAVRENYGKIARTDSLTSQAQQAGSCCNTTDISSGVNQKASCCGPTEFSVENMSTIMGYSKKDIKSVPEESNMGLGCGNPVALASLRSGETVVDLGSGGGFDCFLAAKEVGETGKVIGVDMTPDMVSKARRNAEKMGTRNVEFRLGEIENLPAADNTADIIMSNCVINLSPDKRNVYKEAYRILKPGGRLAISDVLATAELPDEVRNDLALVSACIGGAATIEDTEKLLVEAGFQNIKIKPNDHSRELIKEWDPGKSEKATDYVVSTYIEAIKPSSST